MAASPLTPDEVKGRNMWLVWTGGNDRLWDKLTNLTFGAFDLLKILSSYPGLKYSRDNRWNYLGLVNEPCFTKATGPNPQRYGLWLDVRDPNCPADPFENAQKYPGVAVGARGKNIPVGSYYGYPTGIVGLRLFPNPAFDEAAAARVGCRALLQRPRLLLVEGSGAAVPRRDVVRLLPRRPEPGKAAGEPRGAAMGESELAPSARSISGSTASWRGTPTSRTSCSRCCTPRGRARWTPRWSRPTTSTTRAR